MASRLGHTSHKVLKHLSSIYTDIPFQSLPPCDTCHFAKQKKLPFSHSHNRASKFFELIHVDIWGPVSHTSLDGFQYFLTVVDDFTRFTWTHFLTVKSAVKTILPSFVQLIETQFTVKLKKVRSDNGREFFLHDFFSSKGILHEVSCVETPQQNGIVERKHQHLLNVDRALLFQAKLPICFWSYAIKHAIYLINRLPTPFLKLKSPYELVHGNPPDLHLLRVFGCLAFASTIKAARTKFDNRASKCVFLGFKTGIKGYVLYNLTHKSCFISRNVLFYETHFPYDKADCHFPHTDQVKDIIDPPYFPNLIQFETDSVTTLIHDEVSVSKYDAPSSSVHFPATESVARVPTRVRKPPSYLADYQCNNASSPISSSTVLYPLDSYLSYSQCFSNHIAFCLSVSGTIDPTSYKEASQLECWRKAMMVELQALERNKTWSLITLPPGKKIVGCKWVYRTKHRADGSIECHKARLVVQGFTQTEGVNFFETFSPVVKLTTFRFLLSFVVSSGWFLHQLDVDNTFLHGDLHEEVYMRLPPGLQSSSPNMVCKLHKSLYGLR